MRTCYLHLGMPKTGSSTIQRAFSGYETDSLAYPQFPQPNHGIAISAAFMRQPEKLLEFCWQELSDLMIAERVAIAKRHLDASFAMNNKDIILSGEIMIDRLSPDEMGTLAATLRQHFDRVGVTAPAEPQIRANESLTAEGVGALYAFNKFRALSLSLGERTKARQKLTEDLRAVGHTRFGLGGALIAQHIDRCRDDIDWIESISGFDMKGLFSAVPDPVESEEDLLRFARIAAVPGCGLPEGQTAARLLVFPTFDMLTALK